jgi:hypothetical protein
MKFEVTHPKIWNKLAEKAIPMKHKVKIYEKLGGAYRLGEDGGEQVFNKMTQLETLSFKFNRLKSIDKDAFKGTQVNLKNVYINANQLNELNFHLLSLLNFDHLYDILSLL